MLRRYLVPARGQRTVAQPEVVAILRLRGGALATSTMDSSNRTNMGDIHGMRMVVVAFRPTLAHRARPVHGMEMLRYLLPVLAMTPAAAMGRGLPVGKWDVTSKVVEFAVPGVPGFLASMIRGKSRAERKQLKAGEGVEALLAPDPKARCRVDAQRIADGRYSQALTCPQTKGGSLQIARAGVYGTAGFAGRAIVSGMTPKGAMRIVLDQRAVRVGA